MLITWANCHAGEFVACQDISYQELSGKRRVRVLHPGDRVPKKHFPKNNLFGLWKMKKIDPVLPKTESDGAAA